MIDQDQVQKWLSQRLPVGYEMVPEGPRLKIISKSGMGGAKLAVTRYGITIIEEPIDRELGNILWELKDHFEGGKTSTLKEQLIRLGSTNPELQEHIRPVLDQLSKKASGEWRKLERPLPIARKRASPRTSSRNFGRMRSAF